MDSDIDYDFSEVSDQEEQPSTLCSPPTRLMALSNDKTITMDKAHAIAAYDSSSKRGKGTFHA